MKSNPSPKRILAINSLDARHGSTYRMRALTQLMDQAGFEVKYSEGKGSKLTRLLVAMYLSMGKYDLLFTQKFNPVTVAALVIAKLRGMPTVADWDDIDYSMHRNQLKALVSFWCEQIGPMWCDTITTHSNVIKKKMSRSNRAVHILHQGFDNDLFFRSEKTREKTRHSLGYTSEHFVVGHMCTFTPGGTIDLDLILNSFAAVQNGRARFLLIGGGRLHAQIQDKVNQLGLSDRLTITGLIPHEKIPDYLSSLDLSVVYMSDNEANRARVSFKVLESLAMGVPVMGKLVGESNMLFGPMIHNVAEENFARQIDNAADASLPQQGPDMSNFTWKKNLPVLTKILDQLLQ
ncbi:MAG: glycosyltransferase [Deltaproteobacteria bacterium]|nr:glycosyltransferase [Deltaproteobacteria bacterium]